MLVNDIIITCNNLMAIKKFLKQLANRFFNKDLGTLSYFLRVEAMFISSRLFLSQKKYVQNLLSKMNMQNAKEVVTLLSTFESLKLYDGSLTTNPT